MGREDNIIEADEDFYNRVCDQIGLERVHEGHESDDSSPQLGIKNQNSSVNGGNEKATSSNLNLNMHFDSEAKNKSF